MVLLLVLLSDQNITHLYMFACKKCLVKYVVGVRRITPGTDGTYRTKNGTPMGNSIQAYFILKFI